MRSPDTMRGTPRAPEGTRGPCTPPSSKDAEHPGERVAEQTMPQVLAVAALRHHNHRPATIVVDDTPRRNLALRTVMRRAMHVPAIFPIVMTVSEPLVIPRPLDPAVVPIVPACIGMSRCNGKDRQS